MILNVNVSRERKSCKSGIDLESDASMQSGLVTAYANS